ncbi:hypothetical protein GGI15_003988 [Coemansia interrupta]|uniref:Uncharacterized protein n=1 Tax=Coemansia interrupta TaxID=1126814 RepID=A0A9W8H5H4_9FUNG|nr:hypothetical protein GGI15_003988 [Coemansia interrupta]
MERKYANWKEGLRRVVDKVHIREIYERQNIASWLGNPLLYAGPFPGISMCVTGTTSQSQLRRRRYSGDIAVVPISQAGSTQSEGSNIAEDDDDDDAATLTDHHKEVTTQQ